MNWIRVLIRFAVSFVVLYVLGYIVPGFSGLTIPYLMAIGLITAIASALVEKAVKPGSARNRFLILFLISAVVIYLFSLMSVGRPPVLSTIIAALLVALVDLIYPERVHHRE